MYTITHIVTSVKDPMDRKPIVIDEAGAEYTGPIIDVGFLWKIGDQFFNREGFEVKIPKNIASIDEFIRHDYYSETRDLFFATRSDGSKTIVRTEFFDKNGESMGAFRIEECHLRKYPVTRFELLKDDLKIVPIDLKGTLFEEWINKYQPGHGSTRLDEWLLLKDSIGYQFMYLPQDSALTLCFRWGGRQNALRERPRPDEYGNTYGCRYETYFHHFPEFYDDPILGKCMRIDDHQADEGTVSAKCNTCYNSILLYC